MSRRRVKAFHHAMAPHMAKARFSWDPIKDLLTLLVIMAGGVLMLGMIRCGWFLQ